MPDDREERRAARAARIAARRLRVQARRERVQARREAAAARRERRVERIEFETTRAGEPPKKTALTILAENIEFLETTRVESSWVHSVHLVRDRLTGNLRLAVTFKEAWTGIYITSSRADYDAILAAVSKGKHVWAHLYRLPYRTITAATKRHLAGI
ncbi:MAG: hypothetical protein V3U39_12320 [Acidimicrobiia bacterium]